MALADTQNFYNEVMRLLGLVNLSVVQKKIGAAQANYILALAKNAEGRSPAVAQAASLEMNNILGKLRTAAPATSTGVQGFGFKGTQGMRDFLNSDTINMKPPASPPPTSNRKGTVTVEDNETRDDFDGNRAFDGGLGGMGASFNPAGLVQTLTGSAPSDLLLQAVGPVTIRSQLTPEITYSPGQAGAPPTEQSDGSPGEILLKILKPEIEWGSPLGAVSMAPYGKPTANYFLPVTGFVAVVGGVFAYLAYRGLRDVMRRSPTRRRNPVHARRRRLVAGRSAGRSR